MPAHLSVSADACCCATDVMDASGAADEGASPAGSTNGSGTVSDNADGASAGAAAAAIVACRFDDEKEPNDGDDATEDAEEETHCWRARTDAVAPGGSASMLHAPGSAAPLMA